MKNKISLTVLLAMLVSMSHAQYDPAALHILDAMSAKYKKMDSFKAILTSSLSNEVDGIDETFKGEVIVKGDKFRLMLSDQEIINDGKTQWVYIHSVNEVTVDYAQADEENIDPSKIYDMYKEGYKYLYIRDKEVNGKLCHVVDLVPESRDHQYFKIRMNIVKNNSSLQSWVLFDKMGNRYTYAIDKFIESPKITNSFFTFDARKHKGVEIIDLR